MPPPSSWCSSRHSWTQESRLMLPPVEVEDDEDLAPEEAGRGARAPDARGAPLPSAADHLRTLLAGEWGIRYRQAPLPKHLRDARAGELPSASTGRSGSARHRRPAAHTRRRSTWATCRCRASPSTSARAPAHAAATGKPDELRRCRRGRGPRDGRRHALGAARAPQNAARRPGTRMSRRLRTTITIESMGEAAVTEEPQAEPESDAEWEHDERRSQLEAERAAEAEAAVSDAAERHDVPTLAAIIEGCCSSARNPVPLADLAEATGAAEDDVRGAVACSTASSRRASAASSSSASAGHQLRDRSDLRAPRPCAAEHPAHPAAHRRTGRDAGDRRRPYLQPVARPEILTDPRCRGPTPRRPPSWSARPHRGGRSLGLRAPCSTAHDRAVPQALRLELAQRTPPTSPPGTRRAEGRTICANACSEPVVRAPARRMAARRSSSPSRASSTSPTVRASRRALRGSGRERVRTIRRTPERCKHPFAVGGARPLRSRACPRSVTSPRLVSRDACVRRRRWRVAFGALVLGAAPVRWASGLITGDQILNSSITARTSRTGRSGPPISPARPAPRCRARPARRGRRARPAPQGIAGPQGPKGEQGFGGPRGPAGLRALTHRPLGRVDVSAPAPHRSARPPAAASACASWAAMTRRASTSIHLRAGHLRLRGVVTRRSEAGSSPSGALVSQAATMLAAALHVRDAGVQGAGRCVLLDRFGGGATGSISVVLRCP